jgi:ribosomal-protein-alanine N-acetyltransferase
MINLNFEALPTIETDRLILRAITENDVEDVFEIRSNPKTMRYIPRPIAKNLNDAWNVIQIIKEGIETKTKINWAITQKGNDKLIGIIGYVNIHEHNSRAEVGYVLNENYHRKGITIEALHTVIQYGFNQFNFHSIEAIVNPQNKPSCNLVLKCGFTKDAYFKDYNFHNNEYVDAYVFSLLKLC